MDLINILHWSQSPKINYMNQQTHFKYILFYKHFSTCESRFI